VIVPLIAGLAVGILAVVLLVITMNLAYGLDTSVISHNHNPVVTTIAGERTTELSLGQQAMIQISAHNNMATPQPFVVVVETRDGNGFTEYLAWQEGTAEADTDFEMQFSWTPRPTCEFYEDCEKREIRSFVLSSLVEPRALSAVSTKGSITVSGIPTEVPPLDQRYGVPLHNRIYNVTYSFHEGSGSIADIAVSRDARTLTLSVDTRQDSQLIMAIQKPLIDYTLDYTFSGNGTQSFELYVHADGGDTLFERFTDLRKGLVMYVVNIERGTEQVTLGARLL